MDAALEARQHLDLFVTPQATYTFPVGVTTLWWYGAHKKFIHGREMLANVPTAPPTSLNATTDEFEVYAETAGIQEKLGFFD